MIHIKKLCVGIDSFYKLQEWQNNLIKSGEQIYHITRMRPKMTSEVLSGGSLYWIIKSKFVARQCIIGIEDIVRFDGKSACKILLDDKLIEVANVFHRPFQGWRYLYPEKAPSDIFKDKEGNEIPSKILTELNEFGVV
tara:strand:- start:45 stop:458 length:414 start_codon:yes stop_codon:yes gene_type:complete